ncbi:MAG TPA: DEAD/DEAH box helicase, partial [Xanthobacteraceae bacterium]|nr:DEAD/DEAH box helicase [Xanthobacteraceae bacterium]
RAQIRALERGVDILVATPGRLIDHLEQRTVRLDRVEVLVLDEADHMLDMGFVEPIRRIVRTLPAKRQNLFFSATMPKQIETLAAEMLRNPVRIAVAPVAATVDLVDQRVILVETANKRMLLARILADDEFRRTLVFTRTKHGADRVVRQLGESGIEAAAIHGNKNQSQRERALAGFRAGSTRVLVATDIAARGIDVDNVSHVINFDLPNVPESYVHRIGRTARAGAAGIAISFCDAEERPFLHDIEKLIRRQLPLTDQRSSGQQADRVAAPRADRHAHGARQGQRQPQRQRQSQPHRHEQRRDRADRGPQVVAAPHDISTVGFMRTPQRQDRHRFGDRRPSR